MKEHRLILARESLSFDALREAGVEEGSLFLLPDPAFAMEAEELPLPDGFVPDGTVGINVSPLIEHYRAEDAEGSVWDAFEALIDHVIRRTDLQVALIPHVSWPSSDDRGPLSALYERFRETGRVVLVTDQTAPVLKGYIARCRFFVGARTHATIGAYSSGVPTLVAGYSVKSRGIARDLFGTDKDLVLSRKQLDAILDTAPAEAAGIYVDYIGYMNHRGCYCEECLRRYQDYLKERKLVDTQENKDRFYRDQLVDYYNRVVDYVKRNRPNFKVVVHIYPEFRPDPLYGNRTKADFCGQTVAWYFKWPEKQIGKYTQYVVKHAKDHHPGAEGIPFLGLNSNEKSSLGFKTSPEVEAELKTILAAGGRTLMVCTGRCIIEPGYFEIFRKYCGKE